MAGNCRFTLAVHVCTVLARKPDEAATSEYVAGSVNTSPVVIRRILASLARAGLVHAMRGAGGGYRLARTAAEIDLAAIARAVETDAAPVFPPKPPNPACPVGRAIQPVLADILAAAERARMEALAETRLSAVLDRIGGPP